MVKIRALQPFVGVWGGQKYIFEDGEEQDVPNGFAESVTRSGTLAILVDAPKAPPAAKAKTALPEAPSILKPRKRP